MKFQKRNYKRKALKSSAPKKAIKKAVNKVKVNNLKKIVRSVLKSESELKFATQAFLADKVQIRGSGLLYNGISQLNGWCSGASNVNGIIPAIPQGSAEGQRSGVRVQPKSCYLRYSLQALTTTDASVGTTLNTNPFRGVPFFVRVIVFRHKQNQFDYTQDGICDVGTGNASLGSDIDTYFRPYNKEDYTIVYSKTHKMSALRHIMNAGGGTVSTENVSNGSKTFVIGRTRLPLPKVLRFSDTSSSPTNYPTNQSYFLAVSVCNEDSSVIPTSNLRVEFSAETGLYFTDL